MNFQVVSDLHLNFEIISFARFFPSKSFSDSTLWVTDYSWFLMYNSQITIIIFQVLFQANRYIHESWFDEMSICLSIKKSQSDPKMPHSATEWPQNDPKWPIMSSQMLEACMSCFLFEKYSLLFRSRHEKVRSQSCCYISLCNPNDGLHFISV